MGEGGIWGTFGGPNVPTLSPQIYAPLPEPADPKSVMAPTILAAGCAALLGLAAS